MVYANPLKSSHSLVFLTCFLFSNLCLGLEIRRTGDGISEYRVDETKHFQVLTLRHLRQFSVEEKQKNEIETQLGVTDLNHFLSWMAEEAKASKDGLDLDLPIRASLLDSYLVKSIEA